MSRLTYQAKDSFGKLINLPVESLPIACEYTGSNLTKIKVNYPNSSGAIVIFAQDLYYDGSNNFTGASDWSEV